MSKSIEAGAGAIHFLGLFVGVDGGVLDDPMALVPDMVSISNRSESESPSASRLRSLLCLPKLGGVLDELDLLAPAAA